MQPIILKDSEFKKIATLVYDSFGIILNESKRSLVVNRLNGILRQKGFSTFMHYYNHLTQDKTGAELQELANNISTNHTFFNRESGHFEYYQKTALPEVTKTINDNDLRVWCAASSTGEEPYTLAMIQQEFFGQNYSAWKAGLLATDISEKALSKANAGLYPKDEVNKLPPNLKNNYFTKVGDQFSVKQNVKSEVTFRKLNLVKPFKFKKPFHIIFCRNVMIYFDQPTKDDLIQRMYEYTMPGGYLFIGHSESIPRHTCPYKFIQPAVYRKI